MQMDCIRLERLQKRLLKVEAQIEKYEDTELKEKEDKESYNLLLKEKQMLNEKIEVFEGFSDSFLFVGGLCIQFMLQ